MRKATLTIMGWVEQTDGGSTRFRVADIWFNLPECISLPRYGQFVKFDAEYRGDGVWVVGDEIIRYYSPDLSDLEKIHGEAREARTARQHAGAVTQQVLEEVGARAAAVPVLSVNSERLTVAEPIAEVPIPEVHAELAATSQDKQMAAAPDMAEEVNAERIAPDPVALAGPRAASSRFTAPSFTGGSRSASTAGRTESLAGMSTSPAAPVAAPVAPAPVAASVKAENTPGPSTSRFSREQTSAPAAPKLPPVATQGRFSTHPASTPAVRTFTPRGSTVRQLAQPPVYARPAFDANSIDSDIPF